VRQEQHPDNAGQRRRQGRDDDERIKPRLEVHDDQQVHEQNCREQTMSSPETRTSWSAPDRAHDRGAARQLALGLLNDAIDLRGDVAQVRILR